MAMQTLTEQFAFTGGKVLREGPYPIIKDVLLCGTKSKNGRDYLASAFPVGMKLYEGRSVFLNHNYGTERQFGEKLGWVENERRREDGMPVGDIGINPKHAEAESVLWVAEHKPDFAGFSHVADLDARRSSTGQLTVEHVAEIKSLDLVVNPATTKGFYESTGKTMSQITLKKLSEKFGGKWGSEKLTRFTKMLEMEGIPEDISMPEPAEEVNPDEALTEAIKTLGSAIVDQCLADKITPEEAGEKLAAYLRTHMGKESPADEGDGEGDDGDGEGEPKKESVQAKRKTPTKTKTKPAPDPIREALAVATKIQFRAEESELEIIAASPVEKRESVAKRLKLVSEGITGGPRSAGRESLNTPPQEKTPAPKAGEVKALADW